MTCSSCKAWAATTERQWSNRAENMLDAPEVQPYSCPQCGSTDWAITREFVREEPSLWQRILRKYRR